MILNFPTGSIYCDFIVKTILFIRLRQKLNIKYRNNLKLSFYYLKRPYMKAHRHSMRIKHKKKRMRRQKRMRRRRKIRTIYSITSFNYCRVREINYFKRKILFFRGEILISKLQTSWEIL